METLALEHLTFTYPGQTTPAVCDVSFSVQQGALILLCGQSGCGKSTLLRLIKQELAPHGTRSGVIRFAGRDIETLPREQPAFGIGFVAQDPETQIVTDQVWHEIAFGAESMGLPTAVIRRRVGELASFFGLGALFNRPTHTLSGGEMQLVNLAGALVCHPEVLLLDEPTAQLDPVAAQRFLDALVRLNRELGTTVILAEHRLDDVLAYADRVLLMERGRVVCAQQPDQLARALAQAGASPHPMLRAMPAPLQVHAAFGCHGACPVTVRQGRDYLSAHFHPIPQERENVRDLQPVQPPVCELKRVWFRYHKNAPDILKEADITVQHREIYTVLGANGVGKTTLLRVLAGQEQPYTGQVRLFGKTVRVSRGAHTADGRLALLPQNPKTLFFHDTVRADFLSYLDVHAVTGDQAVQRIAQVCGTLQIDALLDRHPFDLSGGELQRCAIAKLLLRKPELLLLDEPTKGMDGVYKAEFSRLLQTLRGDGVTLLLVTHDVEFAAQTATKCALFFDGGILCEEAPETFFATNRFYTTAASRMARHIYPGAVTCRSVVERCKESGGYRDAD